MYKINIPFIEAPNCSLNYCEAKSEAINRGLPRGESIYVFLSVFISWLDMHMIAFQNLQPHEVVV